MHQQSAHSDPASPLGLTSDQRELRERSANLAHLTIGTFAFAAEHRRIIELLPASRETAAAPVDHRNPIHDQFCRCRTCKPGLVASHRSASRPLIAVFTLGGLVWSLILYSAFA